MTMGQHRFNKNSSPNLSSPNGCSSSRANLPHQLPLFLFTSLLFCCWLLVAPPLSTITATAAETTRGQRHGRQQQGDPAASSNLISRRTNHDDSSLDSSTGLLMAPTNDIEKRHRRNVALDFYDADGILRHSNLSTLVASVSSNKRKKLAGPGADAGDVTPGMANNNAASADGSSEEELDFVQPPCDEHAEVPYYFPLRKFITLSSKVFEILFVLCLVFDRKFSTIFNLQQV